MPARVCEQREAQVKGRVNVCKACLAKNKENGEEVETKQNRPQKTFKLKQKQTMNVYVL